MQTAAKMFPLLMNLLPVFVKNFQLNTENTKNDRNVENWKNWNKIIMIDCNRTEPAHLLRFISDIVCTGLWFKDQPYIAGWKVSNFEIMLYDFY